MRLPVAARVLLWPLAAVYGAGVRLRGWLYARRVLRPRRLQGVVISVGNLTVGGTGKTPMVMWLAERLFAEGRRVAILTRGYRAPRRPGLPGATSGPGTAVPFRGFSDEVWLYWSRFDAKRREHRLLLGVGPDRWEEGRHLEAAGAEWFLLDDGFQHLRLARDVDILLIDSTDPFGGGHLLPAGRLREPKSALGRADLVVITRTSHAPATEEVVRRHTAAPIFYAQTVLTDMPQQNPAYVAPAKARPHERTFFAFCGIGNPAAFLGDLHRWRIPVVGSVALRDHHAYSQRDVEDLEARALAAGAGGLVCTEKDIFNLQQTRFTRLPVFYCRITLHVEDAPRFWTELMRRVERKRKDLRR